MGDESMCMHKSSVYTLFGLLMLSLWGCSDEPANPDEQIRKTIQEAESSIQARNLSETLRYVHPEYRDNRGLDLKQLRRMLAGYFLRHQAIYILTSIEKIEVDEAGEASVRLFAGLAGSAQEQSSNLREWRGDLLRLDLTFILNDDAWLLHHADWRRATPQDFIH
jgi:hypothetical protein